MLASSSADSSPSPFPTTPTTSFQYPLQNPRTQDVFQSIVKGRKSWKTLRGGEVVWPPELEAALIEGLENYQPDDSRETRLLGRFPMRNRFISDWIFEKTGKRRTAKQVGSRLQQLRDTCGGKRLLTLLSPIRRFRPYRSASLESPEFHHRDGHLAYGPPSLQCESDSSSDSSASSPATPIEAHATLQSLLYRGVESREEELPSTIVYIDLLSPDSSSSTNGSLTSWTSPSRASEERSWAERGYKIVRANQHPRHISDIDPTITLLSHSRTDARSHFTVYLEDRLIFSETTALEPVDPATSDVDDSLYKTSLVPGLWDTISQSSDPSQYTIIQRVVRDPSSSSTNPTIFSAIYKFLYQTPSPTGQDFSISHVLVAEALAEKSNFSLDSLLSIDTDAYPDMIAFAKSPDFFDLDFTMRPDSWSAECSPAQSVFPSPGHYPQSMPSIMSDEDDQLLSPTSSFNGNDMSNFL